MKKFIALSLTFLLAITSIVAVAEADYSSYTEADLRELREQIDTAIALHSYDEGKGKAVCDAFIQYMQELGHSLEYVSESDRGFITLNDAQLDSGKIVFWFNDGYDIMPPKDFAANNEAYIRDCMVAIAMAVAQVEGVEIFSNEVSTAMRTCVQDLPDGFFTDNIWIMWNNKYGYQWRIAGKNGTTLIGVH